MLRIGSLARIGSVVASTLVAQVVLGTSLAACSGAFSPNAAPSPSGEPVGVADPAAAAPDAAPSPMPTPFDAGGDSSTAPTKADVCRRFHPGHYFRERDSKSNRVDGLASVTADFAPGGPALGDFAGLLFQIDWAMVEPTPGVYDFTRLDAVLAIVKRASKYLRLKIMERSFWEGCNPSIPIVPSVSVRRTVS